MPKLRWLQRFLMLMGFVSLCGSATVLYAADDIRIDIPIVPDLIRYADLLTLPGIFGVVLENNGLSPSMSSKLQIKDNGQALEIRNASLRYVANKGTLYSYEAAVTLNLGVSESKLVFPVAVDLTQATSGKVVVAIKPPLARLFPAELEDRIRIKALLIANVAIQKKLIAYLDDHGKAGPREKVDTAALVDSILIDAYNKGGGPVVSGGRDVGDAVPLPDQWMLLLTLGIWLLVVPGYLLYLRLRNRRRGAPSAV